MNREQFYVSISRGRERCYIFTDDADLLARRITDSHERKAAVELQALRDELARLGFVRSKRLNKEAAQKKAREDFRNIRFTRAVRPSRMVPMQRFTRWAEELRQWIGERLRIEPAHTPAEKRGRDIRERLRQQKVGRGTASRSMSI